MSKKKRDKKRKKRPAVTGQKICSKTAVVQKKGALICLGAIMLGFAILFIIVVIQTAKVEKCFQAPVPREMGEVWFEDNKVSN